MESGEESGDEHSEGDEDNARPSLRDLAEHVDERRSRSGEPRSFDADAGREGEDISDRPINEAREPERPIGPKPPDSKTEAIIELIGDASNILLLGPLLTPPDHDFCTRLSSGLSEDPENLLLVTLTESPDERIAVYQGFLDELPRRTQILSVGDSGQSATRETIQLDRGGSVTIETISDPTDLMRIGITISRILSGWDNEAEGTAVCFHSLTTLLQFAQDQKTVFRFVHVLRGRLQAAGVTAHFHMDGAAHDNQTVSTFRPLFDEVLTFDEDGTLHVEH